MERLNQVCPFLLLLFHLILIFLLLFFLVRLSFPAFLPLLLLFLINLPTYHLHQLWKKRKKKTKLE